MRNVSSVNILVIVSVMELDLSDSRNGSGIPRKYLSKLDVSLLIITCSQVDSFLMLF